LANTAATSRLPNFLPCCNRWSQQTPQSPHRTVAQSLPTTALSEEHIAWIQREVEVQLQDYYDEEQGSWGRRQKAPLGANNAWLLRKAKAGDATAKTQVLFTLNKQSALIDPVWGGIYQYSTGGNWSAPHYEKLMAFQSAALENYADAAVLASDPVQLAHAKRIYEYIENFMKVSAGAFATTQDADANAHAPGAKFMTGAEYYKLPDAERRKVGIPRIDSHAYARENGQAISAYCAYYRATRDAKVLNAAVLAAQTILRTHASPSGALYHEAARPESTPLLYLADNEAMGRAMLDLYDITRDDAWLTHARTLAAAIEVAFADEATGGMFASSKDPNAVGVFATRRIAHEENANTIRLYARLASYPTTTNAAHLRIRIGRMLRAISDPGQIKARGRMLGGYLLALDESKTFRQ
jgi:uncharacterized protein